MLEEPQAQKTAQCPVDLDFGKEEKSIHAVANPQLSVALELRVLNIQGPDSPRGAAGVYSGGMVLLTPKLQAGEPCPARLGSSRNELWDH